MSQTMTAVFLAGQDCARAATSYFPSFSDRERKVNENSASSAQATEVENTIAPAQVIAVNSRMGHLGGRRAPCRAGGIIVAHESVRGKKQLAPRRALRTRNRPNLR